MWEPNKRPANLKLSPCIGLMSPGHVKHSSPCLYVTFEHGWMIPSRPIRKDRLSWSCMNMGIMWSELHFWIGHLKLWCGTFCFIQHCMLTTLLFILFYQQLSSLIRVAKTNVVVIKLMMGGHKRESKVPPEFDFSMHGIFPIIKLK